MKKGIDISYCQKGLDLGAAKAAGAEFAIIRAGISTRLDTEFTTHIKNAVKEELPYGFYWYSRAFSTLEAKSEAEACIKAIKGCSPAYPIFYDMEEKDQIDGLTNEQRTDIICVFCEEIKKAGYTSGVYINPSWMENYVDKSRIIGKYDIWLAHWTFDPDKPSSYDYGQNMWQWGTMQIGTAEIDANICFKEYVDAEKAPEAVPTKETLLPLGSVVKFTGNVQYAASTADKGVPARAGIVRISNRADGTAHPYHVISIDNSGVHGWIDKDSIVVEVESDSENQAVNTAKKSDEEIALETIQGKWGNGDERKKALTQAGYDYEKVQSIVNRKVKK